MNVDAGKISIVDDDESIRRATKALLRSAGYQVTTFASAELFLEADAIRETDCLVLDIAMSGIDGFELQGRLNDAQSHVPIVFVTAHDNKSERTMAMQAGAADFFHKPFEASAFVAAIESALSSKGSLLSLDPKRSVVGSEIAPENNAGKMNGQRFSDLEAPTMPVSVNRLRATAARLKRENDGLRLANAALTRSNQEFEQFAFTASHDLQEPLRGITVYAELLAQKYGGQLDSPSAMFVRNIVEGGVRMRAMLADLLAYASIGATPYESVELVDLNVVLEKVKQNLQVSIEENGALVMNEGLPTISAAHEFHMLQLFQNLIGNAIKYRSDATPLIRISGQALSGTLEFEVADNGSGVSPENHEKIFEAFKRLHGSRNPGTGIGLAICERVVEQYGGRIWVDSQLGHGATFRFTLPSVQVQPQTRCATAVAQGLPHLGWA